MTDRIIRPEPTPEQLQRAQKWNATMDVPARQVTLVQDRGDLMLPLKFVVPFSVIKGVCVEIMGIELHQENMIRADPGKIERIIPPTGGGN